MSRRRLRWLAFLLVLGGVDLAATIHAHLHFHRRPGGPEVMSVGQLLGWVTSVGLLAVAVGLLVTAFRSRPRRAVVPRDQSPE
jgi:hypothetical protein